MSVTQDGEPIQVGMMVEGKYRGQAFRPGNITNIRADGSVDIAYIDGEQVDNFHAAISIILTDLTESI